MVIVLLILISVYNACTIVIGHICDNIKEPDDNKKPSPAAKKQRTHESLEALLQSPSVEAAMKKVQFVAKNKYSEVDYTNVLSLYDAVVGQYDGPGEDDGVGKYNEVGVALDIFHLLLEDCY